MFKKTVLALSLMALSGAAFSAAAPVVKLKINGKITPPTCTIGGQSEQDFVYDFKVSPGIFPASGNLVMKPQSQRIEVVCDAATFLTFKSVDQRGGTELTEGDTNFGLGTYGQDVKDDEGNVTKAAPKVGFFTVTMEKATVKADDEAKEEDVGVAKGSDYGKTGTLSKSKVLGWATAANKLSQGRIFAADFTVTPTINGEMKSTSGDAKLDGHAVLNFSFGL